MLGQQVLRAGITDVSGIANIADIADVADIGTDIADICTDIADIGIDIADISCHGTNLTHTIAHCSILFPTVGWPTTSALAANLAYLYTLPLCTFFSSLYHNVVI